MYRPMAVFFVLVLMQWMTGTTSYRYGTYSHLLLYAAYGMLAFVVTQSLRRYTHFEMMAKLFTTYGAAIAAFSVLQGMAPNGKIYWTWGLEQGGANIDGPYVNHNHYAGLMEMLTPFPLVLAVTQFTHGNRKIAMAGIAASMAASIFLFWFTRRHGSVYCASDRAECAHASQEQESWRLEATAPNGCVPCN